MTRDQFICEMMGKCWHEPKDRMKAWKGCKKCGATFTSWPEIWVCVPVDTKNPNYSTSPDDILELQQFVMAQRWWENFWWFAYKKFPSNVASEIIGWLFSSPSRFADLVAEYRGYKGGE